MNAYIFVLAAILAVGPALVVFKIQVDKAIADPQAIVEIQKHFFIGIALSKIIPVILLIYGIIKMTANVDISTLYIPWLIIAGLVAYAFIFINSKSKLDVDDETKFAIRLLVTMTRPLIMTIPIMAAFFLFLMTT